MILAHPPTAGELLMASATMSGWFEGSVIYLLDCDSDGSLGVVINKVSTTELGDVLPQWGDVVNQPPLLYTGGPMSQNGAVCLARLMTPSEEPPGWRRVRGDLGLLHLDTPVELVQGAFSDLRIFAGYAGWEPGQLEGELLRGDWHRTQARPEDVFSSDVDRLWRRIMRRAGGDAALMSTWLDDPDLN